ncbi:CpaF family protein [Chromohalobacter sp. TMW 2.2308]|uniref:CpaF family protein n=1 Tax=Chromohalobacter TaxID=42054 RepID=UPI001FFCE19B|nr:MULTISPECIES: CpaF family protein [Chromohalobacter]MCK2042146.1 CpaF family protein [Chromohalobacter moromii]MCT8514294.1 CpaF family protein [Chromohalobacter sp. TMW 2.2271]
MALPRFGQRHLHVVADPDDPAFKSELHRSVIERFEDEGMELDAEPSVLFTRLEDSVRDWLAERGEFIPDDAMQTVLQSLYHEMTGYGPLQPLLRDDGITDILINGPRHVFAEREGKLERVSQQFLNDAHVLRVVRRMLAPLGRRLDESSPMVDARLEDGSRVNAIIPPLALDGPCVSIRKFRHDAMSALALVERDALPAALLSELEQAVERRRNILISGATGSGKTTLLNALSQSIPTHERVVTIEDAAELQLRNNHIVRLETRPANSEGEGEISARQLVRNSLRMRPDRVILGESRGDEVLDVLQAMNTGHLGSMSTVHANAASDALVRLQMMVRLSGFQGSDTLINRIIATALDLVVHVTRDVNGHRHVLEVQRVVGFDSDTIQLETLYHRHEAPWTQLASARVQA